MNSLKAIDTVPNIPAEFEDVPDGVLNVLHAALGGTGDLVNEGAVGDCIARELCSWPSGKEATGPYSLRLSNGSLVELVITPRGKACYAAFATP